MQARAERGLTLGVLLLFVAQGWASGTTGEGGIDAGGGEGSSTRFRNEVSLGATFEAETLESARFSSSSGLIDVLYPEPPELDPDADLDSNGFPDAWERKFFGATGVAPGDDADMDGTSNFHEYLAGTHPRDNRSVFAPVAAREDDVLVVTFATAAGRAYRLRGGPSVGDPTVLETVEGDGEPVRLELPMPAGPDARLFLRIEILIPPEPSP